MDPVSVTGLITSLCHQMQAIIQLIRTEDLQEGERGLLDHCNDIDVFEEALKEIDRALHAR